MKDLLIVSHCILNNAAKVEQDEAELAEEYKIREELMQLILKKDVQLLQLPCPEFIMYGSRRTSFNIHFTWNNAVKFLNRFCFSCRNTHNMWKNSMFWGLFL